MRSKYFPTVGMTDDEILEYYLNRSKDKFPDGNFDYSLITKCKTQLDEIDIICEKHGVITTNFQKHLNSETGCRKCGKKNVEKVKVLHSKNF